MSCAVCAIGGTHVYLNGRVMRRKEKEEEKERDPRKI